MTNKPYLWAVVYDSVFESTFEMAKYHILKINRHAYVTTATRSVDDVESEISAALGGQTTVTHIHEATYLGELLSAPEPQ